MNEWVAWVWLLVFTMILVAAYLFGILVLFEVLRRLRGPKAGRKPSTVASMIAASVVCVISAVFSLLYSPQVGLLIVAGGALVLLLVRLRQNPHRQQPTRW